MFTGSFDGLATRLSPLDGEWGVTPEDQKIFRLHGDITGDFEPVGLVVQMTPFECPVYGAQFPATCQG